MHTIKILLLGLVVLGAFLWIGRALGNGPRAALYFLPAWLVAAAINLWFGVAKAGYSLRDEAADLPVDFCRSVRDRSSGLWKFPLQ